MRVLLGVVTLLAATGSPIRAQGTGGPVEVPLRVSGGRFVVPVMASDGSKLEFALSTGSAVTVFTESGAKRAAGANLTLGGLPVPTEHSSTIPDARLRSDGKVLDGMISGNMLNQFNILIDAPRNRLVLQPTGRSVSWDGVALSDPVPLRIFHGIAISLDVTLGGNEYPATLDLGTPTLVVNSRVKTDLALEDDDTATLQLGAKSYEKAPVHTEDLEIFHRWSPNGDGFVMVGAPIAYDCAVSLSWAHRELRTCVR